MAVYKIFEKMYNKKEGSHKFDEIENRIGKFNRRIFKDYSKDEKNCEYIHKLCSTPAFFYLRAKPDKNKIKISLGIFLDNRNEKFPKLEEIAEEFGLKSD